MDQLPVTVETTRGETPQSYLMRCLEKARAMSVDVRACYEHIVVLIKPTMTAVEVADAWVEAKWRKEKC